MHNLANVVSIFKPLAMVPEQLDSLLRDIDLISLVIFKISSVDEPEVKPDVKFECAHNNIFIY